MITWPIFLIVVGVLLLCLAAFKVAEKESFAWGWGGLAVIGLAELFYRGWPLVFK
jgi:uncharacterized membrane protein